jgi:Fur family zinc uptake transcriptional regulator
MARSSDARVFHGAARPGDQAAPSANKLARKLARADALAAERGLALTTLRRQVYTLIAQSERPVGAYDLLAALEPQRGRVPPTTVYRVLEFLVEHGFVHRIESKNAFFACCQMGEPHQSQFLMCEACGETVEIPGDGVAAQLSRNAPGFEVHHQVVELSGLCAACKHAHP